MRAGMWMGALVVALLSVGALAEQVTRAEFDALAGKVKRLEARCAMLEIGIKALRKQKAEAMAAEEPPQIRAVQPKKPDEPQKPRAPERLAGVDLDAWKLARESLSGDFDAWSDSLARVIHVRFTTRIQGEATTQYMQKTETGDYFFVFYFVCEVNGLVRHQKTAQVSVVTYANGAELRATPLKSGSIRIR